MSNLSQFFSGGGIKSIQTGYFSSAQSTGSGEDVNFVDVTVSSVNTAKCVVFFEGGAAVALGQSIQKSGSTTVFNCFSRMTSSTNLRVSTPAASGVSNITGRWQIVEFQ